MCVGAFIRRRRALLLERRYFRIRDAGSVIWPIVKDVFVKRAGVFAGSTPPRGNTVADNLTPSRGSVFAARCWGQHQPLGGLWNGSPVNGVQTF